jgi:hypothetical protein
MMPRGVLLLALVALAGCGGGGDDPPAARPEARAPKVVTAPRTAEPIGDRVQARIPVGTQVVCSIVSAGGSVWLAAFDHPWLVRVDPQRNRVSGRIRLPGRPCDLKVHDGLLWVPLSGAEMVLAIDPVTGRVVRRVRTEHMCVLSFGVAFGDGGIWVVDDEGQYEVTKRDLHTGATLQELPELAEHSAAGQAGPCALAFAGGSLWVGTDAKLYRVDPRSGRVAEIGAGPTPWFSLDVLGDELWVGNFHFGEMRRLDVRTARVAAIYRFGGWDVAADVEELWATSSLLSNDDPRGGRDPILVRLDRRTDRVSGRFRVGRRAPPEGLSADSQPVLGGIHLAYGSLWVAQHAERRLYRIDPED